MNIQEPLRISSVDLNKIVYPKSRNGTTKKLILIKYNDKSKMKNFVFQTPTLLNLYKPQLNGNYADIELALIGKEPNKVNKFVRFLNELESKVKEDAQYYASSWFNLDEDNHTINFQKIIRESESVQEGTIKIKIIKNNDFETMLQLNKSKRIGIESIPEDSWCKMILECYGIWINNHNDFGIFFRPILVSFTPKEIYNYNFVEDSEEENNFEIPDTDINENIFMKIESKSQIKSYDSTTQLECNELMKHLETDGEQKTTEINLDILHSNPDDFISVFKRDDNVLEINLENKYYSDESEESFDETKIEVNEQINPEDYISQSSPVDSNVSEESDSSSDKKSNGSTSPNIDAETSDD